MNDQAKLKRLVILWIVSYILVSISGSVIVLIRRLTNGVYEYTDFRNVYHIFAVIAVGLYFIPLLVPIMKLSYKLNDRRILILSRFACGFMTIWEFFSFVGLYLT